MAVPARAPARTALDIARHLDRDDAVRHLDALAAATGVTAVDVAPLIERYRYARGMKRARIALGLMDGGARSPKETWLRSLVMDAGYPRPESYTSVVKREPKRPRRGIREAHHSHLKYR